MERTNTFIKNKKNNLILEKQKIKEYKKLKRHINANIATNDIYLKIGEIVQYIDSSEAEYYYKKGITLYPDDHKLNIA
jgi:hypothetical protein